MTLVTTVAGPGFVTATSDLMIERQLERGVWAPVVDLDFVKLASFGRGVIGMTGDAKLVALTREVMPSLIADGAGVEEAAAVLSHFVEKAWPCVPSDQDSGFAAFVAGFSSIDGRTTVRCLDAQVDNAAAGVPPTVGPSGVAAIANFDPRDPEAFRRFYRRTIMPPNPIDFREALDAAWELHAHMHRAHGCVSRGVHVHVLVEGSGGISRAEWRVEDASAPCSAVETSGLRG